MKRSTHPLMRLLVLAALVLAMMLVATLCVAVVGVESRGGLLASQALIQIMTFALPVALFVYIYYRGEVRDYCRLGVEGRHWVLAATGVVIMLLLVPLTDWLTEWNEGWQLGFVGDMLRRMQTASEEMVQSLTSGTGVGDLVANLLVVALVPAVCEELLFRVGVQNQLVAWFRNPHAAVWTAAAIFSLGHAELFAFAPRLLLGAALGYLYYYGGSLIINTMAHFINNACVVVLYWLSARGVVDIDPAEPLHLGILLVAACTVAAVLLFVAMFGKRDEDHEQSKN